MSSTSNDSEERNASQTKADKSFSIYANSLRESYFQRSRSSTSLRPSSGHPPSLKRKQQSPPSHSIYRKYKFGESFKDDDKSQDKDVESEEDHDDDVKMANIDDNVGSNLTRVEEQEQVKETNKLIKSLEEENSAGILKTPNFHNEERIKSNSSKNVDYSDVTNGEFASFYSFEDIDDNDDGEIISANIFEGDPELDSFQEDSFLQSEAKHLRHKGSLGQNEVSKENFNEKGKGVSKEKWNEEGHGNRRSFGGFIDRIGISQWFPSITSVVDSVAVKGGAEGIQASSSKLDEIINGVPAKFIQNADAGLLGILSMENSQIDKEGFDSSCDYLDICNPSAKREVLTKILLGPAYCTLSSSINDEVDDISGDLVNIPKLPFDTTKRDTTEDILKYLIVLSDGEQDQAFQYPEGAWWIEGLENVDGVVRIEDIPKLKNDGHGMMKPAKKLRTSLVEEKFDDDSSTSSVPDDEYNDLREEDANWEERLWRSARSHYLKADSLRSGEKHNSNDQDHLAYFRHQIIRCLTVYADNFHGYENIARDKDCCFGQNNLKVSTYVPLQVSIALFKAVLRDHVDVKSSDGVSLSDYDYDQFVDALLTALIGRDLAAFHQYEIIFEGAEKGCTDVLSQRRNKMVNSDGNGNDRALVDAFLYGIKTDKRVPESSVDHGVSARERGLQLKEIKMRSSLRKFLFRRSRGSLGTHLQMLPKILKGSFEGQIGQVGSQLQNNDGGESISTIYALKYIVIFFLRLSRIHGDLEITEILPGLEQNENIFLTQIQKLLLESSFIRRRMQIFGPYIAIRDHLFEWIALLSDMNRSFIKNNVVYRDERERGAFLEVHHKMISEVRSVADNIKSDVESWHNDPNRNQISVNNDVNIISKYMKDADLFIQIGRAAYELGIAIGDSEMRLQKVDGGRNREMSLADIELCDYQLAATYFGDGFNILQRCKNILELQRGEALVNESKDILDLSEEVREVSISMDLYKADNMIAMGHCYGVKLDDHKKAVTNFREALKLYMHLGSDHEVVINTLQNLGTTYFGAKRYVEALRCFQDRLLLLRRLDEKKRKKSESKRPDIIKAVWKERVLTRQSIGRTQTKLGKYNAAIEEYESAVIELRTFKIQDDRIKLLEEILSELSALYLRRSSRMFNSWTEWGMKFIFCPHRSYSTDESEENEIALALAEERKGLFCLDESLHLRLGLTGYTESTGNRYDVQTLHDGMNTVPPEEMRDFASDLMRNGILKFRQRHYKQAEVDLLAVLKVSSSFRDLNEEKCGDEVDNDSNSEDSSSMLPLLFYLGNLNIRLEEYDNALSFFRRALSICERRLAEVVNTLDEQVGIQLDLARIHKSIGFVELKKKSFKNAALHLRASSNLLDRFINDPNEDLAESDIFFLEIYAKISVGEVLNLLGRVFIGIQGQSPKALVCFEDSMIVLDNVIEEFQQQQDSSPCLINSINKFANGSILRGNISIASFGNVLADSYIRSGRLYAEISLKADSELAFHRAIRIFESLKRDDFLHHDDEHAWDYLTSVSVTNNLLDACSLALDLAEDRRQPSNTQNIGSDNFESFDTNDDSPNIELNNAEYLIEEDGLNFSREDLFFRIGMCYAEQKKYDLALQHLHEAKLRTTKVVGESMIVANIIHNIGLVQRSKFLSTGFMKAKDDALSSFQEAVDMSRDYKRQNELFAAESMFRLAEIAMHDRTWQSLGSNNGVTDAQVLELLETVLKIRLRYYEVEHSEIALTRYLLGKAYYLQHDVKNALVHLGQALSTWKTIFSSFNLDIFDAIYHLGLSHRRSATTIQEKSKRNKELDSVASYFKEALFHSHLFYKSVTNGVSREIDVKKSCIIHSIRCALQLLVIKEMQEKGVLLSSYKGLLSTIDHVLSTFAEIKDPDAYRLGNLSAEVWTRIGLWNEKAGNLRDSFKSLEISIASYSSFENKHSAGAVRQKSISSLLLAKHYTYHSKEGRSSELLELFKSISSDITSSNEIIYEERMVKAALDVYLGSTLLHDNNGSMKLFKRAMQTFRKNEPTRSWGQQGMLYKFRAAQHYARKKYDLALENILLAIPILEETKEKATALIIPEVPETLEDAFVVMEDWDTLLLESYTIALQVAVHLLTIADVKEFGLELFQKISLIYADQPCTNEESFQCLYSLLKFLRNKNGDDDLSIVTTLSNCSALSSHLMNHNHLSQDSLPFHEECLRITSLVLGENNTDQLQSAIELCKKDFRRCDYRGTLRWADFCLDLVNGGPGFNDTIAQLTLLKAEALIGLGEFTTAREILNQGFEVMNDFSAHLSALHKVLGRVYFHQRTPVLTRAYFHYYKSFEISQHIQDNEGLASALDAMAELLDCAGLGKNASYLCATSLRMKTRNLGSDHNDIADTLVIFAKILSKKEVRRAEKYLEEAARIYRLHNIPQKLAFALEGLGSTYEETDQLIEAKKYYIEALQFVQRSGAPSPFLVKLLTKIGLTYYKLGDYADSVKFFKEAIDPLKKFDGLDGMSLKDTLYWFGCALYEVEDATSSLHNFRAALHSFSKSNLDHDKKMAALTKLQIGRIHALLNETIEAERSVEEVTMKVQHIQRFMTMKELAMIATFSAEIYISINKFELSILRFEEALRILDSVKSKQKICDGVKEIWRKLVPMYTAMKNFRSARKYAKNHLSEQMKSYQHDSKEMRVALELVGDVEMSAGDYSNALGHFTKALRCSDGLSPTLLSCNLALKVAKCHTYLQDWTLSIDYLSELERRASLIRNSDEILNQVQFELASVLFAMGQKTKAVHIYADLLDGNYGKKVGKSSNEVCTTHVSLIEYFRAHVNCGNCFIESNIERAQKHLLEAASICLSHPIGDDSCISHSMVLKLANSLQNLIKKYNFLGRDARHDLRSMVGILFVHCEEYQSAIKELEATLQDQKTTSRNDVAIATTLHNLGNCYLEVGNIKEAVPLLEESMALGKVLLGQDSIDVADTAHTLAQAYGAMSNTDEAISLLQLALRIRMESFGMQSHQTLHTFQAMGSVLVAANRTQGALKVCNDALKIQKNLDHRRHGNLCRRTHLIIAQAYISNNLLEQGLSHLRKFIENPKRSQGLPIDHITALYSIGKVHHLRGEIKDASLYFQQAKYEIDEVLRLSHIHNVQSNSSDIEDSRLHMKVIEALNSFDNQRLKFADIILIYGALLSKDDRLQDSLLCIQVAVEFYEQNLSTDSNRIAESLHEKGVVLSRLQRFDEAATALRKALQIRRLLFMDSSQQVIGTSRALGICESNLGNSDYAMELLKLRTPLNHKKVESSQDIEDLLLVGKLHSDKSEIAAALRYHGRCLQLIQVMKDGDTKKNLVKVNLGVADVFKKSGNHFHALMSFDQALECTGGKKSILMCDALMSMGNYFMEIKRYDDAILSYTRTFEQLQTEVSGGHSYTLQVLVSLGSAFFANKNFSESKIHYRKAIDLFCQKFGENNVFVSTCWLKIGDNLMKESKPDEALEAYLHSFSIINSIGIESMAHYYATGKCLLCLQRYSEAASNLQHALKISQNNSNADLKLALARAQLGSGDVESATQNFKAATEEKILSLMSQEDAEELEGALDSCIQMVERMGKQDLDYANFLQRRAICQAIRRKYEVSIHSHSAALTIFRKIHGSNHISVKNSLFNIAVCLNSLGSSGKARNYLDRAYDIALNDRENVTGTCEILFHKGISLKIEKDYKTAKKHFDEALQIKLSNGYHGSPSAAEIYEMVADCETEINPSDSETPERNYIECLRLYTHLNDHKKSAGVHNKIALLHMKQNSYSKAIIHFEKCLVMNKILLVEEKMLIAELYLNLGVAHDHAHSFIKAISCLDLSIGCKIPMISSKALICKGRSLSKATQYREALECFSEVLEKHTLKPNERAETLVTRGKVLGNMGREEEAVASFTSALSLFRTLPDSNAYLSSTCQELANYHLRKGNPEAAHEYVKEALEISQITAGTHQHGESLYSKGSIHFSRMEYEDSLSCLQLALYIFKRTEGSILLKTNCLYMIGCIHEKLLNYEYALISLNESLEYRKELGTLNHIDIGRTLLRLGTVHQSIGEYPLSRSFLKEALRIGIDQLGSQHAEIAIIYEHLAVNYFKECKHEEAIYHINESIQIHKVVGDVLSCSQCYNLKGDILDQAGNIEKAIEAYSLSKKYIETSLKDTSEADHSTLDILASIVFKLGTSYERMGSLSSASHNYSKTIQLLKAVRKENTLHTAEVYEKLANLRGRQQKYDKASLLLEECLKIRIEELGMGHELVAKALYSLGVLFCKRNQFDAGLKAFTDCLSIQQLTLGSESLETADTLHAIGQCLGNNGDFKNACNMWGRAHEVYTKHKSPKVKAIKRDLRLAYKMLEEG